MSLLLLSALLAADPTPVVTFVGNDVVASPDGKVLFARSKGGGVEAIDAATGKALWANKDDVHPFGASDKLAFAWIGEEKKTNAFRVVAIDAATGKTAFKSDPIPLPDWATTGKQFGRSFRAAAHADGDKVVVAWQANAFYAGGARPTPEIEEAARKEAAGVATIDPKTGKTAAAERKPKDAEFGSFGNKVGDLEVRVEEMIPGFRPGAAIVTTVKLSALRNDKVVWTRELAGNPWSPPPP